MPDTIERCIECNDWEGARYLILQELDTMPEDSHWLLTRLSLTYYEQQEYQRALQLSEQAFALAPECPLVLWDYAGTLTMLDRPQEALILYQRIIERGIDSIANGPCGEGRARARGLYADSLYRMSHCYNVLGDKAKAIEMLALHLQKRGPGCHSIYSLRSVRREWKTLVTEGI
jgi:tetratricopeptide (TPR) repeat protein